jgi:phenylpropionate dioxygenase-like ring-hydroxylating dioxygenase large terminal subunit
MKATDTPGELTLAHRLGTAPVPIEPYVSPAWFERERTHVFRRSWLCLAREENLPEPGSYVARDVDIWRTQVLITRAQDGKLRAFHNVCQHRGNLLAPCPAGTTKAFACTFHGWGYDLEGRLRVVPDEPAFFGLDKSRFGLKALACEVWRGFVFVALDPDQALPAAMADLDALVAGYDFALPVVGSYCAEVNGNWKVFMDAFQEAYHVIGLHAKTVMATFVDETNPFCHLTSARICARNRSLGVYGNPAHRMRPSETLAFELGVASTYTPDMAANALLDTPGLNPEKDRNWAFDLHIVFPNMALLVGLGWYAQMQFWPQAVDRTRYEVRIYMQPPRDAGDAISQEFNKVMLYDVLLEDLYTIENTQRVLRSGANTHLQFSDHELACRHAYETVARMLGVQPYA